MTTRAAPTSTLPEPAIVPVDPMPPRAPGALPWIGAGLALLRGPTRFFTETRRALGDTYVVDAFGYRLFCVFSPAPRCAISERFVSTIIVRIASGEAEGAAAYAPMICCTASLLAL